jgi:hypothetical protein
MNCGNKTTFVPSIDAKQLGPFLHEPFSFGFGTLSSTRLPYVAPYFSTVLSQVCHIWRFFLPPPPQHFLLGCPDFALHFVIFAPDAIVAFLHALSDVLLL